ncbi:MAG: ABC transporter substrate-binding protein [Acidobacteriota bacterium]
MKTEKAKPVCTQSHALMLACLCLIGLVGLECGRGTSRTGAEQSTIVVLQPGDERALGPYWDMSGQFLVFLPLAVRDEEGELKGKLAQRWEHSADYRQWTYYLRRDVRWHDGVPVTAHDVKFTMELFTDPRVLVLSPDVFKSITVFDDYTLRVVYARPGFSVDDWDTYYPKHLLAHLDPGKFRSWEFWKHPIGDGPYRYLRHVAQTMIELEANPDYYRGKPRIERVILKFGGSRALIELLSGNVDAVSFFNRVEVPKLARDPRFQVYHETGPGWLLAIYWNHHNPLFGDPSVRRALTLAINRRELTQVLNYPEDTPIFDVIFTGRQFRRGELPPPLPYDAQRARGLLKDAGWLDTDGDGVLEREGKEFRFTAIVPAGGGYEGNALTQSAVYVQERLRKVGIRMEVSALEAYIVRQRAREGEFEAAFTQFFNRTKGHLLWFGERSPIGYHNPTVSELLIEAGTRSGLGTLRGL